jgi:excisionase family DNA binding protein
MVAIVAEDRLLTVPEVADRLRVSEWTVREWLRDKKLKGYRPGGTKAGWRVRENDLEHFIEQSAPS